MIDQRIIKARTSLIRNQRFWGTLAMHLQVVEDETCGSMATDGEHLFYAPSFLDQCVQLEIEGVIAHEVSHCAHKHQLRRGDRDMEEWNIACDYAINPGLLAAGFKLPGQPLVDPAFAGMAAEEIYARRRKAREQQQAQQGQCQQQGGQQGNPSQAPQPGQQPGAGAGQGGRQGGSQQPASSPPSATGGQATAPQAGQQPQAGQGAKGTLPAKGQTPAASQPGSAKQGPGQGGSQPGQGQVGGGQTQPQPGRVLDAPAPQAGGSAEATRAEQAAEWDRRVLQAVAAGRKAGMLPGDAEQMVEEIKEPKINWRELLRRFIDSKTRTSHTWNRPNRRFVHQGIILPGIQSDGITKLGIYGDSSGSTSDLWSMFLGEIESSMELGAVDEVVMIQADTKVKRVDRLRAGDPMPPMTGKGGTSFVEGFKWFEENEPDVAAIICFTDLECGGAWGSDPGVPILWAAYGFESEVKKLGAKAPFGEVIHVEEDK